MTKFCENCRTTATVSTSCRCGNVRWVQEQSEDMVTPIMTALAMNEILSTPVSYDPGPSYDNSSFSGGESGGGGASSDW